jgi:two-component system NtrC family response regulator
MNNILIIDDEEKLRALLSRIIRLEGFHVLESSDLTSGLKLMERNAVDVLICDVKLPDGNGVDFVTQVKHKFPTIEIILLTAYGKISDGIQAMKNGAFDYITKGDDNDKIIPLLNKALEKVQMHQRIAELEKQVGKTYDFNTILGSSAQILDAIALAKKVAPTDATVLLLGETGTGKEVFAQAIHTGSKRANKAFIALNCSAFSKELLESELFGHTSGAFTGAQKDKKGLIESANNGTLFLDEIGELPLELQAKLLRFLEAGEFIKVGDNKTTRVNVRIIAATNRNLQDEIIAGNFREDLYFRLSGFKIILPNLRDRKKDIALLAKHFLEKFAVKNNPGIKRMSAAFLEHLQNHFWKGNIRELKNILERSVILAEGEELQLSDLPLELQSNQPKNSDKTISAFDLASIEKLHIQRVLIHTKGNKTETAKLLNIGLTTLYRKIEEYNIY